MTDYKTVYFDLVRVCPSAASVFSGDNETLPPFILARDFANHLLELFRMRQLSEFPSLSIQIEKFYSLRDKEQRDWATLGILEAIQSVWSATEVSPDAFRRYLLPQSLRDWDRLASALSVRTG